MPSAADALQTAVYARLSGDASLLALLGGARIYDEPPRNPGFPYVTIGQTTERDWSTGSDIGAEHIITLHAWSRQGGKREASEIAAAVRSALHDANLVLAGHRLINLRHELTETRRDPDGETYHGIVRLRAVTEPV